MALIEKLVRRYRSSVRTKLVFMVLLPLVVVLPLLVALLVYWSDTSHQRLLIFKVNSDLTVANSYFARVVQGVGADVRGAAGSNRLAQALAGADVKALEGLLAAQRDDHRLDFLQVLDPAGDVVASGNALSTPANYLRWPIVEAAASGRSGTTVDVYSPDQLAAIDVRLRERAFVKLLPTPKAAPTSREHEDRGMVIHAAAPIYDLEQRLVGVLHGGVLLNGNLEFVDNINSIVYRPESLPLGSQGTATLFLDDVRVATNVRLFQGERALGTRVSAEVRRKVLEEGQTWLDRAFVVNDWYVSAYEPVTDSFGKRIGMLYVGYLETPFMEAKRNALWVLVGLFALVMLFGTFLSLRWARAVFRPLERMSSTMSAVESGDADARVGPMVSRDEIGQLAQHFDRLLDGLQAKNRELKKLADELDMKVLERTRELEQANRYLVDAQRQLVMSEKLAAIGELTAGVAHEINNPIAVIQGNLELLRELLGDGAEPVAHEIRLIDQQVNRIREIVAKLLQFARPSEYAGYVERVDVKSVLDDCLLLVRHLLQSHEIRVVREDRATRPVNINRNELQQVLINLIVNAAQAMEGGGTLTLRSRDWEDRGVVLTVKDTGPGIPPEHLSRIFDPFFTTKKQQGTGLGLSISYALVERYGGTIAVESRRGEGAEFSVFLLTEPRFSAAGDTTPSLVMRYGTP
ncbi:MAG: sensor histidine kinase [Pseudomonadota bacterium]